jgi:hypothetical protein
MDDLVISKLIKDNNELHIINELGRGKSYLARGGWLIVANSTYLFIIFSNRDSYRSVVEASNLNERYKKFLLKFLDFLIAARMYQGQFNFSPDSYLEIFNNGLSLSAEDVDLVVNSKYNDNQIQVASGLELLNDILKEVFKDLTNNFMEHVKNPSRFFKSLNAIKFLDVVSDILILLEQVDNDIFETLMDEALKLYDGYFNLNKIAINN